jgi:hypothetical protein
MSVRLMREAEDVRGGGRGALLRVNLRIIPYRTCQASFLACRCDAFFTLPFILTHLLKRLCERRLILSGIFGVFSTKEAQNLG